MKQYVINTLHIKLSQITFIAAKFFDRAVWVGSEMIHHSLVTVAGKSRESGARLPGFVTLVLSYYPHFLRKVTYPFCASVFFICKIKTIIVGHRREESQLAIGKHLKSVNLIFTIWRTADIRFKWHLHGYVYVIPGSPFCLDIFHQYLQISFSILS